VIDSEIDAEIRDIEAHLPENCLQAEHCFMIYFRGRDPITLLQGELLKVWNDYILRIKDPSHSESRSISVES